MGKGKPRHNNENQQSKPCNRQGTWFGGGRNKCPYFDGDGVTTFDKECMHPWASFCKDGNVHKCLKLKYQWLASMSEHDRNKYGFE